VETLELLRAGKRTSSVARRLGIGEVTVRRHVSELVRKLRVRDRRAALELLDEVSRAAVRPPRAVPRRLTVGSLTHGSSARKTT
jgi:predicted ArsR family transcriptional regulator